jgi:hypothetical protein
MSKSYKRNRRNAYLKLWPVGKQLEAMCDRANGDTTKWDQMQSDFEAIRQRYPTPPGLDDEFFQIKKMK